jgi:DNA-binding transcriptional LysR family regulator
MIAADEIRTFAVFAETVSLSAAARALHLTQPAVHAHLKRLSERLGVPLYHRAGRGLVLTREGIEVAAFARDAVERAAALEAHLRGEPGNARVVLAAGAGALVHVLSPGIRAFTRSYEGTLEILSADASSAVEATLRGAAHVGVGATASVPDELEAHLLTEVAQVLVVPREHPLARRRRVLLSDLDGARLVLPPEGRPQRAALDAAFAAHGVQVNRTATAQGWEVVLRLVELGVGLGVVNGSVRLPRALVGRPLRELPRTRYVLFTRRRPSMGAASLRAALVKNVGAP